MPLAAEPVDARRFRRRRKWIAALSLPGHIALATFALMAALQSAPIDPSLPLEVIAMPVALIGVFCWGFAPFLWVISVVVWFRDPWRRQRARAERIWLRVLVFGSPVAWILSNGINDRYHLLR